MPCRLPGEPRVLLAHLLPLPDVDIYLCGPLGFMSELLEGLLQLGVPQERIFSETFGPQA
jgi:ferredoxin-NADP reductase